MKKLTICGLGLLGVMMLAAHSAAVGGGIADLAPDCTLPGIRDPNLDLATAAICTMVIRSGQLSGKNLARIYVTRGKIQLRSGNYDSAIADFDQVIRLDPMDPEAYDNRGLSYRLKNDYDRAIADYDQAIRLNPKDAHVYNRRGIAYKNKGDYDRAVADFDQAIRLNPEYADAYFHRGLAHSAKGEYDRAIADYDQVIRLDPKDADAYNNRAWAYFKAGKAAQGLPDAERSLELRPDDPATLDTRRSILDALGVAPSEHLKGRRVALVIGNSKYTAVGELPNTKNDAGVVAGELTHLGFEVIEKDDLGVAAMRKALGEFEDKATGAEWAFVYYAGHGMELDGKNWLIPVDAQLLRATDTPDEAIPLERVLARVNAASKLRIVVLDACRNNPFLSRMIMNRATTRAVARGLVAVEPAHGEVVFYAARDGMLASDGAGTNGPFAMALVKHMDEEGIELGRFFRKVTSTVLAATNNQQEPFVYGRIPDEDFYFKPPK